MNAALGSIPSGDRRRLPMPRLTSVLAYVFNGEEPEKSGAGQGAGLAQEADDFRFSVRNGAGWGTANFGQSADEFLSETTDDDHDWRGAGRYYD